MLRKEKKLLFAVKLSHRILNISPIIQVVKMFPRIPTGVYIWILSSCGNRIPERGDDSGTGEIVSPKKVHVVFVKLCRMSLLF